MQKCLKFQFQSKILNKKIFVAVFTIIILFSSNTQVFAEPGEKIDISKYYDMDGRPWTYWTAEPAEVIQTDKILFEVGKHGDVRVKHMIVGKVWHPEQPKLIEMLPGKHSNLEITDEEGDYLRPGGFVGETFEDAKYIIAGQKPFGAYDLVAEYDLENFMELSEDGLWTKHFVFPHNVMILFDDEIKNIFVNSRGIDISGVGGINCMGCDLRVGYFDDDEPIIKKVVKTENKLEEISNTGEEFVLEFFSDGQIDKVKYIEELNYFTFNVNKENQLVWIKIPLDLLLSPYHVYLTDFDQEMLSESDKIRNSEFSQTETHANLSIQPRTEGIVHVVGSTEVEHMKQLEALEKRNQPAVSEAKADVKADVKEEVENTTEMFYESWENTGTNTNDDDTMLFVIVGILAVIIIGIIIKLKKN